MKSLALILLLGISGFAQSVGKPEFEVASVRIGDPNYSGTRGMMSFTDGRLNVRMASLQQLLEVAFDADGDGFRIFAPDWVRYDYRYDVSAYSPYATKWDEVRPMLKALLAERFHVKVHTETKVFPTYQLVIAEGGSKMKASAGKGPFFSNPVKGGVRLVASNAAIGDLFPYLRPHLDGNRLMDSTGLTGKYDVTLEFAPTSQIQRRSAMEQSGITSDEGFTFPALSTALREQLGLRLVKGTAPFEVIVIDSADKVPAEN